MSRIAKFLNKNVEKGKITAEERVEAIDRISVTGSLKDLKDVDYVIEAVIENMDVKQTIFESLSTIVPDDVILASNTSTLSITKIASFTNRADRVIGMHFVCSLRNDNDSHEISSNRT